MMRFLSRRERESQWLSGVAVIACCALIAPVPLHGQEWKELGPAPISNGQYTGRISAVACSPTDSNRYFVAGADGGVWRTTNAGQSWTPLTDSLPTSAIGAIALDPTDEDIIYVGTGEANYANHSRYGLGIYKSTDGGDTWQHLAEETFAGRCFSRIIVHPTDPEIVYGAVTRAGGFPELAAAKEHPGATGDLGIFRSEDGGATWTRLAGLPNLSATDLAIDSLDPQILYAAIGRIFGDSRNGIYQSIDGGDTWTKLTNGLPSTNVGRISVAVAPSNPDRLYAMFTDKDEGDGRSSPMLGAFRSDNAGQSWSPINLGNIQATYGYYLSVILVHPTDPNTAFFGGLSMQRTRNGGSSFSTVTPPHVDLHALAWDASGRLVAGDDGGVHRSADLGSSWVSLNNGLGVIQFYAGLSTHPTDPLIVFGGTQDNGSNRRSTNSRLWTQVFGGDGGWTQLDQRNPNVVFVEFQGTGNLFKSTNGGGSFQGSSNGISGGDRNCFLPPYLINPHDSSRMLYATHRVYRSVNAGGSWTPISGDLTDGRGAIRAIAQSPVDPDIIYAATNDGNVHVSFDEGSTWQQILDDNPGWPRVTREIWPSARETMTMYLSGAVFGVDQILRSTDAGQTFETLDGDLPDIPVNVVAEVVRGGTILFAGTDTGVYFSDDDGATWRRYGDGLPNAAVIDIIIDDQFDRIVVGTQGRGAWEAPLGPETAELIDFTIVTGTHLDGDLADLADSDDLYLHTRSGHGHTIAELHQMEMILDAESTRDAASSIDIGIESRIDEPAGTAIIRLRNWRTGELDEVARYGIGGSDEIFLVEGLDADDYIDSPDGAIEVSVKHVVIAPFLSFSFESFFDQIVIFVN